MNSPRLLLLALLLLAGLPRDAAAQRDSITFIPRYEVVDTTEVGSRVMTIREIIARCTESERSRFAGHDNVTFTASSRIMVEWKNKRDIYEEVELHYEETGGWSRSVRLDEREVHQKRKNDGWALDDAPEEEGEEIGVRVRTGDGDLLTEIPFFLEEQEEFDFDLLDRTLEDDSVIFKIAFRPKSDFKPLPSYVDTERFQIVHEEFVFENNPVPLFLKGIDRVSRQWKVLPTGEWVPDKLAFRVRLRGGWTGVIPESVRGAVLFEDYAFDQPYDAHRFGERN